MKRRLRVFHLFPKPIDPAWNWDDDPVSKLMWPASAFVRNADRARFEVIVGSLVALDPGSTDIPAVRIHALDTHGRGTYARAIVDLARWLKAEQIDVVQTHLFDATVVGLLAARLAGTPLAIASGHHSHEFSVMPRGMSFVLDKLCVSRLADHVIVPSLLMRDTVTALYQMPADKVTVVPHGLDARRLISAADARARVRAELGIQDQLVLGAIGRLFWIKQYETLVRSFAAAARSHPNTTLVIVGEGDDRERLLALAQELGVGSRVKLIGHRGRATEFLAAIDLFVHPALIESFGLVLIEAMAAGKPVLTTAVGIAPEVIVNGENGMLVPASDLAAFTRGLAQMLAISDRWEPMGQLGQRRAREFTAQKMVAAHEAHYLDWLAARDGSAGGSD